MGVHKLRLQEEGGKWSKKLTFCKLLYHTKCKQRAVGGQKKTNLLNVVCERPLMEIPYFQLRFVSPLNEMWAYSFISHFFGIYPFHCVNNLGFHLELDLSIPKVSTILFRKVTSIE